METKTKRRMQHLTTKFMAKPKVVTRRVPFHSYPLRRYQLIAWNTCVGSVTLENKTTAPTRCFASHPPETAEGAGTFPQSVEETEPELPPGEGGGGRNNVFRVNQKELGRASPQRTLVNGVGKVRIRGISSFTRESIDFVRLGRHQTNPSRRITDSP
ncbi:hypothetical protein K0M31_013083 [Melipona bicolor]|uniref:Uncharacterized protein n=1 Tax=Melipona bicolor TaxID=60889 RepID=A0AA40KGS9_9HYME|nr:hypothetical protein K0M31_013083 [Melipona bicolor]